MKSTPFVLRTDMHPSILHSSKLPHANEEKVDEFAAPDASTELAALLCRSAEPPMPKFDRRSPFLALLELQQKYCVSAFCRLCM